MGRGSGARRSTRYRYAQGCVLAYAEPYEVRSPMSMDLLLNAIVAGILLGGFYAAVTVGVSISFGMLDVVNIAHPAFIIVGSYIAYIVNSTFGLDPILTAILVLPAFYL